MRFAVVSRITSPSYTKPPTAFHEDASSSDREVMALPIDSCFLRPRGTDTWPLVPKRGSRLALFLRYGARHRRPRRTLFDCAQAGGPPHTSARMMIGAGKHPTRWATRR